jgi:uncharacterized protein (DUF1810 family)
MNDPFDLQRFVDAQREMYQEVCAELRAGRKQSHWMWFIFPQIRGLGRSSTAVQFAISGLEEAQAYAGHVVLGKRLDECTGLVNAVENCTISQIFGYPDDLKFHASMTLFAAAVPGNPLFTHALEKYFSGKPDPQTRATLG